MNLSSFFKFNKSFHILLIIIVFSVLADETLSADLNYEACVPQNCGNGLNISYNPYWIAKQQESYCGTGHPNFQVTCNGKNPVLNISGDDYVIKDIFYTKNSFLLVNAMAYYIDNTCPILLHNFTIEETPDKYSLSHADLLFFYNCSSNPTHPTYRVDCASNATQFSFAVHKKFLEFQNYQIESCHSWDNASVEIEDFVKMLKMKLTDVLRKGFVLQWTEDYCSDCERSGGKCVSVNNEFTCFCSDRPHSKTCDDGNGLDLGMKCAIGFGAGGTLLVALVLFVYHRRCNKKHNATSSWISRITSSYTSSMTDLEKDAINYGVQTFSYNELEKATNNFDSRNEVGDGGFGTVYQGKLRDGRVVAVKRLYEHNFRRVEQFMNEVEILTRLRHQNLVSLYGCTSRHCRELLLVYEFIPNGTVADHLHGDRAKPGSLSWTTRMSIATETANALAYLHASDVIHRDVKTNNILLDNNFCVKVADFGLSRLFPTDVSHVSTAPQGTPGYVDPEYHECYQLTGKSDVYSFGVVLIELISSKPAVDITRHRHEINLSNMAINKIQNNELHELVDPCLGFKSDYKVREMITAVAELAFHCLQSEQDMRPSMDEVLEVLKGIGSEDYNAKMAEEVDIPADDVVLLKSDPPTLSSDSLMEN